MRRFVLLLAVAAMLIAPSAPAGAGQAFPDSIPLPDGFYPEGIAIGPGTAFYAASLLNGALYEGDLRTGEGAVVHPGEEGRVVAGLSFDARSGLLWGVGFDSDGPQAYVFDAASGDLVATVPVPGAFINDVVVTRTAAYITDSFGDVLWTIALDARGRAAGPAQAMPLSGDFTFVTEGDLPVNLNGIDATPNGKWLIGAHTALGTLYRIDPGTGEAVEIDLGGASVPNVDGIVLRGHRLYAVQNFSNQVSVVQLRPDLTSGEVVEVITSDLFRVPTTAAVFGSSLYLVNGRFDVAFPPFFGADPVTIDYDAVTVPL